jgi:hypothetical protein
MMRVAGTISRVLALRDDALAAEQARVLEYERSVLLEDEIKHQSRKATVQELAKLAAFRASIG